MNYCGNNCVSYERYLELANDYFGYKCEIAGARQAFSARSYYEFWRPHVGDIYAKFEVTLIGEFHKYRINCCDRYDDNLLSKFGDFFNTNAAELFTKCAQITQAEFESDYQDDFDYMYKGWLASRVEDYAIYWEGFENYEEVLK